MKTCPIRRQALLTGRCWLRGAFSLVEMLVAVAVLLILGLLVAQMTDSATRTTRLSNRAVGAASQARLAFDRIGLDLGGLVKRSDADFLSGNPGLDTPDPRGAPNLLAFLAGVSSPSTSVPGLNRGASLIAYRLAPHAENDSKLCLVRSAKSLNWAVSSPFIGIQPDGLPVPFTGAAFPAELQINPADFDVISPGVIRMVIGFQLHPDDKEVTLSDGSTIPRALGQIVYRPPVRKPASATDPDYIDLSRISALVVGVVSLDLETLKLLSPADVAGLAGAFSVPNANELPVKTWMTATNNLASLPSSVPLPARQAVRVFQRFYPITPYGTQPL